MSKIEELADRVERLLLRHEELQRTNALLHQQLAAATHERDNLRSRLNAARRRIDALLERLPHEPAAQTPRRRRRRCRAEPDMKQIEVTILGQSYILGCPEGGEAALLDAVGQVDREMSAIRDGGKVKARERIAVLAALNLAYALAERPAAAARSGRIRGRRVDRHRQPDPRIDTALRSDGQLL